MTNLSVNINKVATIRNARGGNMPDVLKVAQDAEAFGAQGITVHPRPDERHIRYSDVYALKPLVKTEFNIEGYPCEKFIDLVLKVRPTQVTLVPDAPDAITSNAGWDVKGNYSFLSDLVECFTSNGIRTSIFVGTDLADMQTQLDQLDEAINEISTRRGTIGSTTNRLESAMDQLDTQYENLSAANSRITDADIATESSNYIKNQILQQASASLLTQANQQPNIALSLI